MKSVKRFLTIFRNTFVAWRKLSPLREGAVVAYFAVFSVPALLVLIVNISTLFVKRDKVQEIVFTQIRQHINESTATQIEEAVQAAGNMEGGTLATILGILVILFAATRVFVHMQTTLNNIWRVKRVRSQLRTQLKKSLFSIALILTIAIMLLISMLISTLLTGLGEKLKDFLPGGMAVLGYVVDFIFFLFMMTLLFALMFRFLPDVKLEWRTVIGGAVITGLLFMLLKYALGFILAQIRPASMYGAAGSIVLVMIWFAVCSMMVFFGAQFSREYAHYHKQEIMPRKGAELMDKK